VRLVDKAGHGRDAPIETEIHLIIVHAPLDQVSERDFNRPVLSFRWAGLADTSPRRVWVLTLTPITLGATPISDLRLLIGLRSGPKSAIGRAWSPQD